MLFFRYLLAKLHILFVTGECFRFFFYLCNQNLAMMEEKKYNRSFAGRLSRWVMLVLFIMMSALGYLIYKTAKGFMVEVSAYTFHNSIKSSGNAISGAMSDVSIAVKNNIFDIERQLSLPNQLQAIMERIVANNPRIRSCGISFVENY